MIDHFSLLNEPRRPWLDPAPLKARFLELSASVHPDRFHTASPQERRAASERYAELNAAHNCLGSVKDRLRHLIELEIGGQPEVVRQVPEETMEMFMKVGQLTRDTDAFLDEKDKTESPLLKAGLFEKGMTWTDRLQTLQGEINAELSDLNDEIRNLNPKWESAPDIGHPDRAAALPMRRVEEIYRAVSHLTRWTQQLQERIVRITF
mgnify:CR=1 FL=1